MANSENKHHPAVQHSREVKDTGLSSILLLGGCETMPRATYFLVPPSPHLHNGRDNGTSHTGRL